ncbi:helix-turn-helix domain-containing protein [Brevundimonas variabilis]|uniref:Transcriptional regulator with XRE-family HTH domain n=1 Tax=Brevundimonas variabilis TaxID=74312 RepID=A0A7W9CGY1_9CAUL|nr:helix-turn-helix transcriptional regulator [Brevundimonas variabilis]MBB5745218.1 transcriptional regulator with XRE-family HTH domain [Brevundimonas variabilis]
MSDEPTASDLLKAAIGERLMIWRLALRMSRESVARKADVSVDYVYRLEQGWEDPTVTTLHALALALETNLHELLEVSGEELGLAADNAAKMRPV